MFLYGQAATMTDFHIAIYGLLSASVVFFLFLFYRPIEAVQFDRNFAGSAGISVKAIEALIFLFLVLAVVIGIRSVGVILMSGMLIAPAAAARQFTNRLSTLFCLSACIGMASAFLGSFLSLEIPYLAGSSTRFSLPPGPMILLTAATFCLLSLFFAPRKGWASRLLKERRFARRCRMENILKQSWKGGIKL